MFEERTRNGVYLAFYGDGSGPSFHLLRPGATYIGINDRLNAERKGEDLTVNGRAASLAYTRDVSFCYLRYMVISGDLGRMFPPQPFARGFLPILHMDRVLAFHGGESREVLEFNPPGMLWSEEKQKAVQATVWLIRSGWSSGFVRAPSREEVLVILDNLGLTCDADQLEGAIARCDFLTHSGYSNAFRGADFANTFLGMLADTFEPFVKVKAADVKAPENGPFVKYQGAPGTGWNGWGGGHRALRW